jgi:hypothetical protein
LLAWLALDLKRQYHNNITTFSWERTETNYNWREAHKIIICLDSPQSRFTLLIHIFVHSKYPEWQGILSLIVISCWKKTLCNTCLCCMRILKYIHDNSFKENSQLLLSSKIVLIRLGGCQTHCIYNLGSVLMYCTVFLNAAFLVPALNYTY